MSNSKITFPHYNTQIRQGRVERITEKEVIFKNGHRMPTTTPNDTLYVDCSTASTGFAHPKVILSIYFNIMIACPQAIFSGDTINLQMVMLPQPCYSASIIAALELKYPEDEAKKNQVIPVGINNECVMQWGPEAYWIMMRDQTLNGPIIGKLLGFNWMRRSRLSGMKFFGTLTMIKIILATSKIEKSLVENLNKMEEEAKTELNQSRS